jgi:hypothetical protein
MKPYDGGGWRAVTKATTRRCAQAAYDESGKMVMHVQAG